MRLRGHKYSKQTAAVFLHPICQYMPSGIGAQDGKHVLCANSRRECEVSAQAL